MLQVWLLGQFDVRLDGKRVLIQSRAAQSLLAYLILKAGTPQRREKLAGLLWPEMPDESARSNLRHELWRVRKAITSARSPGAECVVAEELTIAFNPQADYWLDVTQLEKAAADPQSLISSLTLYRGELLPGFFDDWVGLERERIQAVFEAKMQQLLEGLIAEQRWLTVLEWAERWIALGQSPEPAYRALMLAHGALGDRTKVGLDYERCIQALRDDLGVEPSGETRALKEELTRGEQPTGLRLAPLPANFVQTAGTVTFLFSDLESSTEMLEQLGEDYAAVLADQRDLLRTRAEQYNGFEVDTQGDASFLAFFRAIDAVRFAADAQRALAAHPWPRGARVRLRMGIHTGEPMLARTGYVGMDVHRAARIASAGHGGQVLLSQATRGLVESDLTDGSSLRDLGEHRLKDLRYPVRLFQLDSAGLPADFPPLKTLDSYQEPPAPGEPPFKGLAFFDEADANLFHGREPLVAKLTATLLENRFLAVVVGASGSGKSSVVRAGVIPMLKKAESFARQGWQYLVITPTAHPLEALALALTRRAESLSAAATLMDDLARDPRSLHLYLRRQLGDDGGHLLLVVDQFEELFTLARDELEREQFIDNLLYALNQSPNGNGQLGTLSAAQTFTLVLTIRADFYAYLAQYPELRALVAAHQEYIGPMSVEELRRAIAEPALQNGWEFEPGLVDLMLRDVGDEPGALPLLSHALLETWKRRSGHTLTLKGYQDAGGVRGAIAQTAETMYQQLAPKQQPIARDIFLRLTELGESTEDTRRRATFAELVPEGAAGAQVRGVLRELADARLVTLGENAAEVAHEALIREWPRLREWLNEDREGLRLHRQLTEAAQEWAVMERDPSVLYRGARLAQAQEFAANHSSALNEHERSFLAASAEQAQREIQERELQRERELQAASKLAEEQQRRADEQASANKRIRQRAVFLVGALLLAIVMMVTASAFAVQSNQNQQRAEDERRTAFVRELSASAINNLTVDPERSILLALQAVSISTEGGRPVLREAEEALHRAVQSSRVLLTLRGHDKGLQGIAINHDSTRVASISLDGTARLWDLATGQPLLTLPTLATANNFGAGAVFSRDGTRLLTVSGENAATFWDLGTGKALLVLRGHSAGVSAVAISPDGKQFATASNDKTAKIWDAATGQERLTLAGHKAEVLGVAFNADGLRLITASADGSAKVWDTATGRELLPLEGNGGKLYAITASPDGTRIAAGADDTTLRIWDAASGKLLLTLFGHTSQVTGVAFSADGRIVASGSEDGTAKLWDAASGRLLLTLVGHTSGVLGVAFSAGGSRLITASRDATGKVWDISAIAGSEWLTLAGHRDRVYDVAYSPDGTRLATSSYDSSAKVWDAATGQELLTLSGHRGIVWAVRFSPDGRRLATAADDGTVRIWDSTSGAELLKIAGAGPGIVSVGFSPDGTRLAAGSAVGDLQLYDAANGTPIVKFVGHSDRVEQVSFSPDGRRLVSADDDALAKVWDVATGTALLTFTGHNVRISGIAYSPDGKRLATTSNDGTVKVWDAQSGAAIFTLRGHLGAPYGVAFSPDGQHLASSSVDATVKVWTLPQDGEEVAEPLTLYGHAAAVYRVAFSPDGRRLATASRDGTARVFALPLEDIIAIAKSRVTRGLTTDECQKYLHVEQCPGAP